ncbi:MAG: hypothetical protein JRK53_15705 [Deltaproteobacteria bacterium]|nr:hypothetical protein [Deltaproteobacteria bacterium]
MDFTKMYDPNRVGIANHAKDQPDKPALIMNDRAVTFRQLHEDTNALCPMPFSGWVSGRGTAFPSCFTTARRY